MKDPCKKISYIDKDGNPVYKDKIKYNTKAEAKKKTDEMNSQKHVIHQLSPYLCPKCHKWHIGRSTVETICYGKKIKKLRKKLEISKKNSIFEIVRNTKNLESSLKN